MTFPNNFFLNTHPGKSFLHSYLFEPTTSVQISFRGLFYSLAFWLSKEAAVERTNFRTSIGTMIRSSASMVPGYTT